MLLLIAVLAILGYDPQTVVGAIWDGSIGSASGVTVSIAEAMPIILTATAVWLAYQAGLFNIGGDGQLQVGGVAALIAVLFTAPHMPALLAIPMALLAAAAVGAAWAAIAGALKAYRGANEVIATIMLNFAAIQISNQLIYGPLRDMSNIYTIATHAIPTNGQIPAILPTDQVSVGIFVALVVSIAAVTIVYRSDVGLRLRAIGLNREAATYSGIVVNRYWMIAFTISGAICGLGGGLVVLGARPYLAPGWAEPWGLLGILVAFLCLRTPYIIPVWGLLFGMLMAAGPTLKASASVPDSIVIVMQTLPVIVLYGLYLAARYRNGLTRYLHFAGANA